MSRDELQALQGTRLNAMVRRVYHRVPFYKSLFDEAGLHPDDIQSLEDLKHIPFTTKDDLRHNYPYGMFAVGVERMIRLHASSGTTGQPTAVGYTRGDLETWTELVARIVVQAGVRCQDIAQISFGYGLFTGGFGLHYGLEKVGATVLPVSSGNTRRQIRLMRDFGSTVLVSTPSYALHMAEVAKEEGIEPLDLPLRLGLFGGEPWSEGMREELERVWGIKATDNYGLSEIIGPGVAGECLYAQGMHLAEDHFIAEIIDPNTGEVLPEGEQGELVITTLTKEGFPLLRYRTRDITSISTAPCPCGRTTARMMKTTGRTDDMLIIKGVNVFPSQIEEVLMGTNGVAPHYQIIVDRNGYTDTLEILVELPREGFTDNYKELEDIRQDIIDRLLPVIGLLPTVKLVEYRSLERSAGKAKRVIDKRQLGG
jgi:phenylacetate-CoA ligase